MIIHDIDTKDISVVVQGSVARGVTQLCLASVREHLPEAEIILSTWVGSDLQGLDYDKVVYNQDPGGFDISNVEYSYLCNYERQQLTTVSGLKASDRKYAVKLRTDFMLEGTGFLRYFGRHVKRNPRYSFLKEKVIACQLFSRNPLLKRKNFQLAIHPSDIFFFGLREDLLCLFDGAKLKEEDKIWFARKYPDRAVVTLSRFVPEQYLWYGFLCKFISEAVLPEDSEDLSEQAVALTEKTFASNLIILDNRRIGLKSLKNSVFRKDNIPENCYSYDDWRCLYLFYCRNLKFPYVIFHMKSACKNSGYQVKKSVTDFYFFLKGKIRLKGIARRLSRSVISLVKQWRGSGKDCVESFLNQRVEGKDISVIVQGAVSPATKECLNSIRKVLPEAEIILSTWNGADVTGLSYDRLVLSEDVGSNGLIRRFPQPQIHNVNREIVSTLAGLREASRYYCMKLRTDMKLENGAFLSYYNKYSQYLSPYAIFDRRVMVEGMATGSNPVFSVSDWWYFGTRQDLLKLFDIPLYPKEEVPYYERKEHEKERPFGADIICRYLPEQYIIYKCMQKYLPAGIRSSLDYKHFYDISEMSQQMYERFIADNLLCVEFALSGVVLPKAINININSPVSYCYNMPFIRWLDLCSYAGTEPQKLIKAKHKTSYEEMKEVYHSNPQYYDIENYASIVKNYSRFENRIPARTQKKIDKSEITFVVCGLISTGGEYTTRKCLTSIRRFFAKSKIILATWKNQDASYLKPFCDEILYLDDAPGKKKNNYNRQSYLVHEAMKHVTTKYAVRFRTDFYLFNDNLLSFYLCWLNRMDKTDGRYQIFSQRVLVFNYYTRDPRTMGGGYTYYLSDCLQLGLTEDLLKLWDGHQLSRETLTFFENNQSSRYNNIEGFASRYTAEQYFLLNVVKKSGINVKIPDYYNDNRDVYTLEYEKVLAANCIIGNAAQLGVCCRFTQAETDDALISIEKLVTQYLYHIDPGNQKCLDFLKELYGEREKQKENYLMSRAEPAVPRSMTGAELWARRGAKGVMRLLLPAYRVGDDVRKSSREWRREEEDRLDALNACVDNLQAEVLSLKKQLRKEQEKYETVQD